MLFELILVRGGGCAGKVLAWSPPEQGARSCCRRCPPATACWVQRSRVFPPSNNLRYLSELDLPSGCQSSTSLVGACVVSCNTNPNQPAQPAPQAANYLNIKSLLDLTCLTVANMIKVQWGGGGGGIVGWGGVGWGT